MPVQPAGTFPRGGPQPAPHAATPFARAAAGAGRAGARLQTVPLSGTESAGSRNVFWPALPRFYRPVREDSEGGVSCVEL